MPESPWLLGGLGAYALATLAAWRGSRADAADPRILLAATFAGALLLAAAIATRWLRIGYGPFLTLYEVLLSNLFSLGLICALGFWLVPLTRAAALLALPLLLLLGSWILGVPAAPGRLPETYDTLWLWVHVGVGKVFLGASLLAAAIAGALSSRPLARAARRIAGAAEVAVLDELAWRLMAIAFVFDSLMLIAGAVWAQDAWGRFWAWDPLETSAFVTWLVLGFSLHLRLAWSLRAGPGRLLIVGVFVLAFLTFFGVPFASLAPHKGIL